VWPEPELKLQAVVVERAVALLVCPRKREKE
jgi:hypothetical protein